MYQIIKLPGVSPEAMLALHEFVQSDATKTNLKLSNSSWREYFEQQDRKDFQVIPLEEHKNRLAFVKITDSRLDPKHGTYTIELRVEMAIETGRGMLYPPFSVLQGIYTAIADYYPAEERLVSLDK